MKNTPQVAVIGSGYWGKNLVRNFNALNALTLICDKNESVLAAFRDQYPKVNTCMSLNQVLSDDQVDGVVIATPAETHYALARDALLSGKHLYVEKPLVLDEAQAEELIALAEERQLTLMVGHLLQYHPVFVRLLELTRSGELGKINYIYSHRLNLGKIRREENILWSFAPHDISMILSLAGEEPEAVFATGGNYLHKRIADVTTTHLEFPSGIRAHIFVSWLHPFKEQRFVVVGDRKMAVFDDTLPWEDKLLLYPHEIRWENNVPVPAKAEPERVEVPHNEPLRLECEEFLTSIATGNAPRTDGREGLRVLKVLNTSQRSLDLPPTKTKSRTEGALLGEGAFVHPTSEVDEGVKIGAKTKIWHFSHVLTGSIVGKGCNIGQNVVVGPNATVADGCKIQNNVSVYSGVTLEDDVFCGPSMVFTNVRNPRSHISRKHEYLPTLVKKGASIGANATIVCGNVIGRYAFIGAGAVVSRNVPDHALMVGNPARRIAWMCSCGEKLDPSLTCPVCAAKYVEEEYGLRPAGE